MADPRNDDVLGSIPPITDGYYYADTYGKPVWGTTYGYADSNGFIDRSKGSAEQDVERYRGMGSSSGYVPTIEKFDRIGAGQSNLSRAQQNNALALQRAAARGEAPSRAELLGRNMIDESMNAQMSAAASTRGGPAAQAAAARSAQSSAAAQRQRGMNDLAALRADEMAKARGDYMAGASAIRGQDLGQRQQDIGQRSDDMEQARAQAGFSMEGRRLDDANRQFFEQLAWNTRKADLEARQYGESTDYNQRMGQRAANQAEQAADWERTKDYVTLGTGAGSGFIDGAMRGSKGDDDDDSDERTKVRMGSLGRLTMTSDDRAKVAAAERKAYLLGRAHQGEQHQTGKPIEFAYGGPPKPNEDIVDADPSKARRERVASGGKAAGKSAPRAQAHARQEQPAADAAPYRTAAGVAGMAMPVAGAGQALYGSYQTVGGALDARNTTGSQALEQTRQDIRAAAGMTPDARATFQSDERTKTPMAEANRSMVAEPYAYRPEYAARNGQEPGELNVGPMAQRLAKDPVARTAVVEGEDGMLAIDQGKGLKLVMGGVADLQRQVDDLKKKRGDK